MMRIAKISMHQLRLTGAAFFLVLLAACSAFSADIVFVPGPGGSSVEQKQFETAATFYGVNLKVIAVASANDDLALRKLVEEKGTVGVAISADALPTVDRNAFLRTLQSRQGGSVPVVIVGVAAGADQNLLSSWSGGAVLGCKRLENPQTVQYVFGRVDGVTGQLSDLEIPLPGTDTFYLVHGENSATQPITSVRHDNQIDPAYVEAKVQQQEVFVVCANYPGASATGSEAVVNAFLQNAPALMFVRHAAGERGWHAIHSYANLTIDDPWLRQPYGYVDYEGLLGEMERHNFHTTIAFIPWNYNRSEPGVVSLFHNHPDRFSISVHGDNHDHKEFTEYRSKPLNVQIADMKQSLARMEQFKTLTGIPYDNVMVFPHSIAPEKTLEALKTYNYLATVNSSNVPQGARPPAGASFDLRAVTLTFAGFPSFIRYSIDARVSRPLIAINEYLGNPLLFYGHSDSLAKGVDSFDVVADQVNKLEPNTKWQGLGDIARHSYLIKLRSDSNYDVLAFSSGICLENLSGRDSTFYVRKPETGPQTIGAVTLDGQPYPYQHQDGALTFNTMVPSGKTRCAAIQYENDLQLASIGISHDSFIVSVLRMASDFRDIDLSKSSIGLALIRFYNKHEMKPKQILVGGAFLFLAFLFVVFRLRLFVGNRHLLATPQSNSASGKNSAADADRHTKAEPFKLTSTETRGSIR